MTNTVYEVLGDQRQLVFGGGFDQNLLRRGGIVLDIVIARVLRKMVRERVRKRSGTCYH